MADSDLDPRVVRTRNDVLAAAIRVLIDGGWEAVTQPNVARAAGYSKATVYTHWPERFELLRDALARFGEMPHHEPTGELRTDLIGELDSYRRALVDHRLDRVLAVLAERSSADPDFVEIRDEFVASGEQPMRRLLADVAHGAELDAMMMMLGGSVINSVFMHGEPPSDGMIEAVVDTVLERVGYRPR